MYHFLNKPPEWSNSPVSFQKTLEASPHPKTLWTHSGHLDGLLGDPAFLRKPFPDEAQEEGSAQQSSLCNLSPSCTRKASLEHS